MYLPKNSYLPFLCFAHNTCFLCSANIWLLLVFYLWFCPMSSPICFYKTALGLETTLLYGDTPPAWVEAGGRPVITLRRKNKLERKENSPTRKEDSGPMYVCIYIYNVYHPCIYVCFRTLVTAPCLYGTFSHAQREKRRRRKTYHAMPAACACHLNLDQKKEEEEGEKGEKKRTQALGVVCNPKVK